MPKPFDVPGPDLSPGDEVREHDDAPGVNGASLETVPKKKRKRYSASEKLRIVKAAKAAVASGKRGALEKLLRKEGIYSSHLSGWREQFSERGAEGLAPQKPGRKPKLDAKDREILALKKQLAKIERKLQVADAVIGLQKKAHEVLGIALPEFGEESS